MEERNKLPHKPPLLVKIAPDLSRKDKEDIAAVILREEVIPSIYNMHTVTCKIMQCFQVEKKTFVFNYRAVQMD